MTDFKKYMDDFSNLFAGMSSLSQNLKNEAEQNFYAILQATIKDAGFVSKDDFNTLAQRFEEAVNIIQKLQTDINELKKNIDNLLHKEETNGF